MTQQNSSLTVPQDEKKYYYTANIVKVRLLGQNSTTTEPQNEEKYYYIEKIVDKRVGHAPLSHGGSRTEYLVQWKGCGDADKTWETEENLKTCNHLIKDFEENLDVGKKTRKSRKKLSLEKRYGTEYAVEKNSKKKSKKPKDEGEKEKAKKAAKKTIKAVRSTEAIEMPDYEKKRIKNIAERKNLFLDQLKETASALKLSMKRKKTTKVTNPKFCNLCNEYFKGEMSKHLAKKHRRKSERSAKKKKVNYRKMAA